MTHKVVKVAGRDVALIEQGNGEPLVYLHGFADVHGVAGEFLPFHTALAENNKVIAPAHPGCNGSAELRGGHTPEDYVFHYLELFDALGLNEFNLVGHCLGGWIAAEIAVRHPEKVKRLGLIGASGLFVSGEHIGDIFMHSQPERGVDYTTLRHMLFTSSDAELAQRYYPDGRGDIDEEVRRYEMLRLGSFVGFRPPYFYNRSLVDRLHRARMPALVVWGGEDHMVPVAHAQAYAKGLPGSGGPVILLDTGHAAHMEAPEATGKAFASFLAS
ncbi:MAG: alpha/beta hydrolase [Hyphomicrobiales bacterium]|nr:alpha/beta hydrolase [Hyphomicrobiales bacterium]